MRCPTCFAVSSFRVLLPYFCKNNLFFSLTGTTYMHLAIYKLDFLCLFFSGKQNKKNLRAAQDFIPFWIWRLKARKLAFLERFCIPLDGIFKTKSFSGRVRVLPAASRRWLSTKSVLHLFVGLARLFDSFLVHDEPSSCPGAFRSAHCSSSGRARRWRSGRKRTSSSSHLRSGRRCSLSPPAL